MCAIMRKLTIRRRRMTMNTKLCKSDRNALNRLFRNALHFDLSDTFVLIRSRYANDSMNFSESLECSARKGSAWITPLNTIYKRSWMRKKCEKLGFSHNSILATVTSVSHSKECYGNDYYSAENISLPMKIVRWPSQTFIDALVKED